MIIYYSKENKKKTLKMRNKTLKVNVVPCALKVDWLIFSLVVVSAIGELVVTDELVVIGELLVIDGFVVTGELVFTDELVFEVMNETKADTRVYTPG